MRILSGSALVLGAALNRKIRLRSSMVESLTIQTCNCSVVRRTCTHQKKYERENFMTRSEPGIFVGMDRGNAYRILKANGKLSESKDVDLNKIESALGDTRPSSHNGIMFELPMRETAYFR